MNKHMKQFLLLLCIAVFAIACKRRGEPKPIICINDKVYKTLDTITVVNCSERYTKQRWVLPDGASSNNNTVFFVPIEAGTYTFKLYVSDDDFVNEYEAIRQIDVVQ